MCAKRRQSFPDKQILVATVKLYFVTNCSLTILRLVPREGFAFLVYFILF